MKLKKYLKRAYICILDKAYLCMADLEYSKKFYNKNKHYKVRLYAKTDASSLYDEYEVKDWCLSEKGLELDLG